MNPNVSATKPKFLNIAAALVLSAVVLCSLALLIRYSRHWQSAKLGQPTQVVAANAVATVRELAEPWSSKTFIFHDSEAKGNTSAAVIRLPDSAPDQPASYWAFSLKPMFGSCQLEYIINLQKLSSEYGFEAKHPMVGDPCSHAVFDPLQMADLPGGAWARGAIVKGYGFRPPMAIEIEVRNSQLFAAKIE